MSEHTGTWVLDQAGSSATIAAKTFWGLMTVRGTFGALSGHGTVAEDGTASGTLVIDASSINTKNASRDKHLKSADFFDVEAHPSITLTVEAATQDGDKVTGSGTLEAAGHAAAVSFVAAITEDTDSSVTLAAQLPVNYRELGITWNQMGMLGPVATATVAARFTKA
jgi:polyisoprenoid-binding protein YceI